MGFWSDIREKFNPSQREISLEYGTQDALQPQVIFERAYDRLEVVNRGVNMIVDAASQINIDVGDKEAFPGVVTIRNRRLNSILNRQPNPYQTKDGFMRNIYLDMILDGNAFMYYDGAHLYHLPAKNVTINPDTKTFVKSYNYHEIIYRPDEIIHIRDNSSDSIYRGRSRLVSAEDSIDLLYNMRDFQATFLKRGSPRTCIKESKYSKY